MIAAAIWRNMLAGLTLFLVINVCLWVYRVLNAIVRSADALERIANVLESNENTENKEMRNE